MGKYKLNQIKVDFGSYRHYVRGVKKIGKTTMFRDLVLEEYGSPEGGLLISFGNETGYKALSNLYADEAQTWDKFVEIVDDLVKNKAENKFRVIGLDTVDEMVAVAVQKALDEHYKRTQKRAKGINDVFSGYGAGRAFVSQIINQQIARLERAGYGLFFIGHGKLRDVKEKDSGEAYQVYTSNLEAGWDGIFADKADIIATLYTEKVIVDGKLKDKNRVIYFRNDGFIDCGSRFSNMPEKVEMSAKNYLEAFRKGVKSSMDGFVTDEDIETLKKSEVKEREIQAEKYIEHEKAEESVEFTEVKSEEEYKTEIITLCKSLGGSSNTELMSVLKKYDESGNPNRIKDILVLEELLDQLSKLNEMNKGE